MIVEFVKIYDIKLKSREPWLYMKSTVLFLFKLEHCINHVHFELCQKTYCTSKKFKQFVTYLRQNCITNKCDTENILRKIYDNNSLIDCELIAYTLNNIVHNA